MTAEAGYQQIVAFAPYLFKTLGVSPGRADIILQTLKRDDVLVEGQPNLVALLEMKDRLEALEEEKATIRIICKNCQCCNTIQV